MGGEYNDKALEECFRAVHDKLDSQGKYLVDIHKQVKTTNGRVTALESWQNYIKGGMTVLTMLAVPVVLYVIYTWIGGHP